MTAARSGMAARFALSPSGVPSSNFVAAVRWTSHRSAKYSCSGSPLMFWNGRMAIEGLAGCGSAALDADAEQHPAILWHI